MNSKTFTRQSYTRNMTQQQTPDTAPEGTEIWYSEGTNSRGQATFTAATFTGKAQKPAIFSMYYSAARRQEDVDRWLAGITYAANVKTERQQARKEATCPFKPGDVLYGSWGYDQTNVEFYTITAVAGRKITLRELSLKAVAGSDGFMCESVIPDKPFGPEITKIAQTATGRDWYIKLHEHCHMSVWNGNKQYRSWYA